MVKISEKTYADALLGQYPTFDALKDNLEAYVVPKYDKDRFLDGQYPCTKQEDIVIAYSANVGDESAFLITDSVLDNYGISVDDIHEIALANTFKKHPPVVRMVNDVIEEATEDNMENILPDMDLKLMVIFNKDYNNGAIYMFNTDIMDKMANDIGDFYIIPSSVNECMIYPAGEIDNAEMIRELVEEINNDSGCVKADEVLSNNVYSYNPQTKRIELAAEQENDVSVIFQSAGVTISEDGLTLIIRNTTDEELALFSEYVSDNLGFTSPFLTLGANDTFVCNNREAAGFIKEAVSGNDLEIKSTMNADIRIEENNLSLAG